MVHLSARLLLVGLMIVTLLGPSGTGLPTADGPDGLAAGADVRLLAGDAVQLWLGGTQHTLTAHLHPILSSDAIVGTVNGDGVTAGPAPAPTTYVGTIRDSDLSVRLSLDPARPGVEGLILTPDGTGWLLLPRPDGGADVVATLGLTRDGIGEGDGLAAPTGSLGASQGAQEGTLELRLALEVDNGYRSLRPNDWRSRILEIVSYTEMVYTTQLDVVFNVTYLAAWEEPDPYTARHACWSAVDPGADGKLEQFAAYWEANRQEVPRDAAHLFATGFSEGRYGGCAYIEVLDWYAYGVSRTKISVQTSRELALWDNINLFAHELGHNFGGYHEKSAGLYGATGNPTLYGLPPHTIMDNGVNSILRFSEADGVHSPVTGWELDNAGHMRAHAAARLGAA